MLKQENPKTPFCHDVFRHLAAHAQKAKEKGKKSRFSGSAESEVTCAARATVSRLDPGFGSYRMGSQKSVIVRWKKGEKKKAKIHEASFSPWTEKSARSEIGAQWSQGIIFPSLVLAQDLRSSLAALVFRPFFVQSFLCPHALFACLAAHIFFFCPGPVDTTIIWHLQHTPRFFLSTTTSRHIAPKNRRGPISDSPSQKSPFPPAQAY